MAAERRENDKTKAIGIGNRREARLILLNTWQREWEIAKSGRWTYRFISYIGEWFNRRYGAIGYHLTQGLVGHGCFAAYQHRFNKLDEPMCWYCGHESDDAYHTLFQCDAWLATRRNMYIRIGEEITPENMISHMLDSKEKWDAISDFIIQVLMKKESEERRWQRQEE